MPKENKDGSVSVIYNQKNDSPKYFELSKKEILSLAIGLPTISIIALTLGIIGLIHVSPFHLLESYKQNLKARAMLSKGEDLNQKIESLNAQNIELTAKLKSAEELLNQPKGEVSGVSGPEIKPIATALGGVSSLSFFKTTAGFKDRTKPAILNLSGFSAQTSKDTIELSFNIIPATNGDEKLSGFIHVIMKNELGIQVYPPIGLTGNDNQIVFSAGEPFATQRFRPVVASFLKPRRSGNYLFTVFIFARNGDLIHVQSTTLPLKI